MGKKIAISPTASHNISPPKKRLIYLSDIYKTCWPYNTAKNRPGDCLRSEQGFLGSPCPAVVSHINGRTRRYWPRESTTARSGGEGVGCVCMCGKTCRETARVKYHCEFDWNWTSVLSAAEDGNNGRGIRNMRKQRKAWYICIYYVYKFRYRKTHSISTPFCRVFDKKKKECSIHRLPLLQVSRIHFLEKLCKKKKKMGEGRGHCKKVTSLCIEFICTTRKY